MFYDKNWKQVSSAAHQFTDLSAIAYDETDDLMYFNDQDHSNGTIFSLKLTNKNFNGQQIEKLVQKTKNEIIQGIVYDPVEKMLYWTDSKNKIIYNLAIGDVGIKLPNILFNFTNETPQGISIDFCRR